MHECELCGEWCDCDGEDHAQAAPEDCTHACDFDDDDDWYEDEDECRDQDDDLSD